MSQSVTNFFFFSLKRFVRDVDHRMDFAQGLAIGPVRHALLRCSTRSLEYGCFRSCSLVVEIWSREREHHAVRAGALALACT